MKGSPYLAWPMPYLRQFFTGIDEILFIPYAGVTVSYDEYTAAVTRALAADNIKVTGIHTCQNKPAAIQQAQCLAVGGGNTFQLLALMQQEGLTESIRQAVNQGTPYVGWSAGSNVACPTIMTTNDMPIVRPDSFAALNLTDFQINAHYTSQTIPGHGGESRETRLKEFLTVNPQMKVVGLPEGRLLEFVDGQWYLQGIAGEPALLFMAGREPVELPPGRIAI